MARRELWKLIEGLKGNITILLTTHYLEEAQALSDRVGIMAHGKLKALGTAQELTAQANAASFEDAFVTRAAREVEWHENAGFCHTKRQGNAAG